MNYKSLLTDADTVSRCMALAIYYHKRMMQLKLDKAAIYLHSDTIESYKTRRNHNLRLVRNTLAENGAIRGLTTEHVIWASRHDWYVSICHLGSLQGIKAFDSVANELVEFYSFQRLREWAGY